MNKLLYPPAPAQVFEEKLRPGPAFRKQAIKVVASILLFLATYLALLAAALLLAAACGYAGIWMMVAWPNKITLLLGAALILLGLAVLFFLVKFVFATSRNEKDSRVEITEAAQPALFAFIRQLTQDTNTRFPKKIYISPDVNACVFYHSSFWSMFFPVRKNLEIGLGLVNSLNASEFKAVMAHEFGHFSQRSMKLGSFTYSANRIIYNMLYDNNGYNNFLQAWGGAHAFLAVFAQIAAAIAQGIQGILKEVYGVINKSYMALSREMEFHADTVAASVAGGNNLVTALSRIEMAASCYDAAIDAASNWLKDKNQMAENIFSNQLSYFKGMAFEYDLPVKNGLPHITYEFVSSFATSRINYNEQWASHPTLQQRKDNMEQAGMNAAPDENSAWQFFQDPEALQLQLTRALYNSAAMEQVKSTYTAKEFDAWVNEKIAARRLPAAYKGYYDKRVIDPREEDLTDTANVPPVAAFDDIFNDGNRQLWASITANKRDMALLKAFQAQQTGFKRFDFDGAKYSIDDCHSIIAQLETEIAAQLSRQQQLDKQAYLFFYTQAGSRKQEITTAYQDYKTAYLREAARMEVLIALNEVVRSLIQDEMPEAQRVAIAHSLAGEEQQKLKTLLASLVAEKDSSLDETLTAQVNTFLTAGYTFYDEYNGYKSDELNALIRLMNELNDAWSNQQFKAYKTLLETQLHICQQQQNTGSINN